MTTIPWIGYEPHMKYHKKALLDGGFTLDLVRDAHSGLTLLNKVDYPLIIVQAPVPVMGELEIPGGIDARDIVALTGYLLELIREIKSYKQTPIIVPSTLHPNDFWSLRRAGATEIIELVTARNISGCVLEEVIKYVKPR
jgi:hypothetical protein